MAFTVSLGGPGDIATAVDIYRRASTARLGRNVPEFRLVDVAESLRKPNSWFFLVRDNEHAIAMAHAMPSRLPDGHGPGELVPGLCYLYLIFVVADRWGEGIGAQLLEHVMADARDRGFSRIHLWTHENNERAHQLYEHRGYARTGRAHAGQTDSQVIVSEWARHL
jgi:GNAT superfamily N-acetyltransferase